MRKFLEQIVKFGLVGVIATLIDFSLYTLCNAIGIPYLISGIIGFVISLVFNYVASMKFVFVRRDDISRQKEFLIFVGLSCIGLLLNELILYIGMDVIYLNNSSLQNLFSVTMAQTIGKAMATAIVMIYNFISRKVILEKK